MARQAPLFSIAEDIFSTDILESVALLDDENKSIISAFHKLSEDIVDEEEDVGVHAFDDADHGGNDADIEDGKAVEEEVSASVSPSVMLKGNKSNKRYVSTVEHKLYCKQLSKSQIPSHGVYSMDQVAEQAVRREAYSKAKEYNVVVNDANVCNKLTLTVSFGFS
jgi:hypothetical protein